MLQKVCSIVFICELQQWDVWNGFGVPENHLWDSRIHRIHVGGSERSKVTDKLPCLNKENINYSKPVNNYKGNRNLHHSFLSIVDITLNSFLKTN